MIREPERSYVEETRFKDWIATIRRRWFLILITMVIVIGLAVIYSLMVTPVYRSVTVVELHASTATNPNVGLSPLQPYSVYNPSDINTDIAVFESYNVMRDAMVQLNRTPPQPSPDLIRDPQITAVEAGPADALQISVDSTDSALAHDLANILPSTFQKFQLANQQKQLNDTIRYIQSQYQAAVNASKKAQQQMTAYREKFNVSDFDLENQSRLHNLEDAKAAQRQATIALAQATNALASVQATYDSTPKTISSPNDISSQETIIAANATLTALKGKLATAQVIYKNTSPVVQQLQAQVKMQQKYVDDLPKTISRGGQIRNPILDSLLGQIAQNKAAVAGATAAVNAANGKVAQMQSALDEITRAKGAYDTLKLNLGTVVGNIDSYQKRLVDLQQRQSEAITPVHVIGEATPVKQVKPNWILNMVGAFIFAVIVAWATVSVYERWDDRIYATEMGKSMDGLRSIGAVPLPASTKNNALVVTSDSPMADSFRVLRSNLLFTVSGEAMRSIAVVSPRNSDGRSDIAINLAASLSLGSHQVVLIDANLRRPYLHRALNLVEGPGLTDVLLGYKQLKDVIQTSTVEGLSVITAGTPSQSSTELLSAEAFGMMLDELKDEYHFIIVDTVACLAGADAQVTADACDASVFVIKVGATRKSATRYCIDLLKRTRTNLLGIIYNRPGHRSRPGMVDIEDIDDDAA